LLLHAVKDLFGICQRCTLPCAPYIVLFFDHLVVVVCSLNHAHIAKHIYKRGALMMHSLGGWNRKNCSDGYSTLRPTECHDILGLWLVYLLPFPSRRTPRISTDLRFRILLTETTQISDTTTRIPIHTAIQNLRAAVRPFGPIKAFRAYWDFAGQSLSRPSNARNELSSLSSSGLTLIDCPGNGRKDHAVKIMLGRYFFHTIMTTCLEQKSLQLT